jgi:hypothetical protein
MTRDGPPGAGGPSESPVRALLRKSRQALSDARYLLDGGRSEAAANRLYYAAIYAARAALQTEGERPNSPSGVLGRFSYPFIRTGRISETIGKALARAKTLRGPRRLRRPQ